MAIHELYTRIVEELEKDPDFWDKHMRLLDDALSTANDEEKQLIDVKYANRLQLQLEFYIALSDYNCA